MKKFFLLASSLVLLNVAPVYAEDKDEKLSPEMEEMLKDEQKQDTGLSFKKDDLEKVNTYLEDSLKESHDFAIGGDTDYDLHLTINKLEFLEDGRLVIQVEPEFIELSEDDKNSLVNTVEGMGQLAIFMELKDEKALSKDIFLSFRNGKEIIGNSKILGDGIKWKE